MKRCCAKKMLRRVRQTARCHQILLPGFVGGGSILSLALPIMTSLKGGRVRYIDKISMVSVLSWLSWNSFLHTKTEISWDRCHIYLGWESKREDLRNPFNGSIIYGTLLDNLLEFNKEDCAVLLQLRGSLPKSGPLDFATKNTFALFFVGEEALVGVY